MASSVFRGERVYWKTRRFSKPGYTRVTLGVNQAEYDRAYDLCRKRHLSAMEFDAVGMLSSAGVPVIEVHISNPHAREEFRRDSVISPVATGVIAGFGFDSYRLALRYLITLDK
jgi:hypothetical protein